MTDQPHTPEPCDHHWKTYLQPKNVGLSWIRQCSQCGDFDTDNLREQVATAEQRGAIKALRDAAGAIEKNNIVFDGDHYQPCNSCMSIHMNWLDYRADQMEGDDE